MLCSRKVTFLMLCWCFLFCRLEKLQNVYLPIIWALVLSTAGFLKTYNVTFS